jgi:glycine/serine hydroxymethyltransferase
VSSSTARPLSEVDPEVHSLIHEEYERQKYGIELIASEVPPPTTSFSI